MGAERELREALAEIDQEQIQDELSACGVQWSLNPPATPWFGGAWESLIISPPSGDESDARERTYGR